MHSTRHLGNEPRIRRMDRAPRAHRIDHFTRCTLSDCCGAPVIQGGMCFECRDVCEEDDEEDQLPGIYLIAEPFDRMALTVP